MSTTHLDPPDAFTPDCSWCGDDPRPTAFCCAACEDASRVANVEHADTEEPEQTSYERDLVFLERAAS